jgi:hypothetical protein
MAKVHDLLDHVKTLEGRRDPWMPYWQQLADVLLPTQADFTTAKQPGSQRGADIYDGTPRLALRELATTIDGLIKPKTSAWFDVETEDETLNEMDEVKLWLEQVKDRMWHHIYKKDARFIQRSCEVDLSLVCFGWGTLWITENKMKNGLLFRSFHNSQVAIDENDEGIVDKISVAESLTARQVSMLYQDRGKDIPKKIQDAFNGKDAGKKFKIVKLVMPRDDYDPKLKLSKRGMPWYDALIDVESEEIIEEGGFNEFPAAVPRWETSPGDVYTRSPGSMALPDAKTLQAMGKTLLIGGQRAVDPPIWIQNDSVVSALRTFPGGITVIDASDVGNGSPVGAFPVATNLPIGRDMQADYRAMVEAAFFKNIFRLPIESRQMTATEIIARKEEFIRTIGPVFGRLETDYIGHTTERTFAIMDRAGAFPPRPDALQDVKITFKFQSPIQQARKQMEIASLSQSLTLLAPIAEVQPEIMDNFDGDEIARDAPEWGGLPNRWMRNKKAVESMRAQRAQGQGVQQTVEASGPLTDAIKNVAQAESMMAEFPQ